MRRPARAFVLLFSLATLAILASATAHASDHLDTPSVIADPAADIGDLFAWTAADGKHLNLVMTIVGHHFSDQVDYVFHLTSAPTTSATRTTGTTANIDIVCRFNTTDGAVNDTCTTNPADTDKTERKLRTFTGLRDDPFFNNVKGLRAGMNAAAAALKAGVTYDPRLHGCPTLAPATVLPLWRTVPPAGAEKNFLAGWKINAIVVSIELATVTRGGPLVAVWAGTYKRATHSRIDRAARALTANALVEPLAPDDISDARKEAYNRAAQSDWPSFIPDIEAGLALYDGFDGVCGNQWSLDNANNANNGYHALAQLLADDRLWVDTRQTTCKQYLAVELGVPGDCGGRTPTEDAVTVFRSLLVLGKTSGAEDGVDRDDKTHSTSDFPFLAAP